MDKKSFLQRNISHSLAVFWHNGSVDRTIWDLGLHLITTQTWSDEEAMQHVVQAEVGMHCKSTSKDTGWQSSNDLLKPPHLSLGTWKVHLSKTNNGPDQKFVKPAPHVRIKYNNKKNNTKQYNGQGRY